MRWWFHATFPVCSVCCTEDKRAWLEPPIPGYEGYIPRIGTTELGLGGRYHVTTGDGLRAFKAEKDFHEAINSQPINLNM